MELCVGEGAPQKMMEETQDLGQTQPVVSSMLAPGTMVDHYKVVRLLGRGGFGDVYLARDTKLGRKIALKLLNASQFGADEVAQRFIFEARATARFNHPHIVAIYGVGEHGKNPYVALEYLEGQTLRDRKNASPPSVRAVMRIGLAIAEALREAHSRKILHCDLKPENVLIPKDGRLRLFDFGLAMPVQTKHPPTTPQVLKPMDTMEHWLGGSRPSMPPAQQPSDQQSSSSSFDDVPLTTSQEAICGTPEYMAPEQWLQHEPTGATDIWALGTLLYELVGGVLPYCEPSFVALAIKVCSPDPVPPLPESLEIADEFRQLIADCLEKDPAERPTAAQVVERLEQLVYRRRQFLGDSKSPFPGLMPFSERYADFFFGRESEIDAFLERMRQVSVLPVVGPSGAGKSSFVEAGVIPRLKEQGPWRVLRMRPGTRPFAALAARVRALQEGRPSRLTGSRASQQQRALDASGEYPSIELPAEPDPLEQALHERPSLLGMILQDVAEEQRCSILLFVDQLEELYSMIDEPDVRRRFMEAICGGAHEPRDPVRVIFTLRDDFLGRLAEGTGVREALSQLTVMRSPGSAGLREILLKPAEAIGYRYDDPALVGEMVEAVQGKPACLPLLQFATRKMWDHRDQDKKLLRRAIYDRMGGVEGALADHADGVLQGLSAGQVTVARDLLLRLVTPDGTRRILAWNDTVQGLGSEAEEILNRLIQSRLVLVGKGRGNEKADAELELVHESLVRRWYRLARWFDESRDELALLNDLTQVAELWEKRGRREQEVWQGKALREAEEVAKRNAGAVSETVLEFLQVSRQREERLLRRKRAFQVAGVTLLVAVALGASIFAWALADKEREATRQRDRAEQQSLRARKRFAEAQREAARAALLRGDPFEARAKLRMSLETTDSPQARALWWQLTRTPLAWQRDLGAAVYDLDFSPDGKTVAAACQDRTVYLFDVQTQRARFLRGHRDQVYGVAFSPDGKRLASGTWGGKVGLWDLATGKLRVLAGHTGKVHNVAFSPDGKWLASASYDRTARLWRVADGAATGVLKGHGERCYAVAFAPDSQRVATGGFDGTVRLWKTSGELVRVLRGHRDKVFAVAFSPDGKTLASGGLDQTLRLWNAGTGRARGVLVGHQGAVHSVAFSSDGRLVATGGYDGTVRLWDARRRRELQVLSGHDGWVLRVAFNPRGDRVASSSMDRSLRLWNLGSASQRQPTGHGQRVFGAAISPDGRLLATGGMDRAVRLWNLEDGTLLRTFFGHQAGVFSVGFSPDGNTLASGSWDRTIRLWDVREGTVRHVLEGHGGEVSTVLFSPDGNTLASGSWDKTVRLWDARSGAAVALLLGHEGAVYDLSFHPGGRTLASGAADQTIRIWDVRTRRATHVLKKHEGPVYGVDFSPDGASIISGGADGTWRRWSAPAWDDEVPGRHEGRIYHLAFHPSGQLVGTPSADGTARIWDLRTGKHTVLAGHHAEVNFLRFSPDGRLAVTTSDDGTIRTWQIARGGSSGTPGASRRDARNRNWRSPAARGSEATNEIARMQPFWRAPLLLPRPPRVFTHRGWLRLDTGAADAGGGARWSREVEQHTLRGASSADGRLVAIVTTDGSLQLWDRQADRQLFQRAVDQPATDLRVLPGQRVVLLSRGRALLFDRSGAVRALSKQATAVGWDQDQLLVAADRRILLFDSGGRERARLPTDLGATAVALTKGQLAVGNRDGNVELIDRRGGTRRTLKQVPSSAVLRILPGPKQTLVLGYANGLVGIWSLATGERLIETMLHGPVEHLHLEAGRLYAVTSLGDHTVLDLRVFTQSYCPLLKEVWSHVKTVWEGGRPVPRPPPDWHRCAE
jgi:WD40 repeat protein/serine/threonine protein kinase